ncbi:MAG TPA: hypothetical protein VJT31_20440, partial [Rugosimonospora sp.]|nr:hypothetical protein [Rugosimonospora sp.]
GVPLVPALPERRGAGWRAAVFAGAAVVVLLACSLGGFKVFQSLASSASSGNNANGSRTSGSTNHGSQGGVNPGSGVSITAGGRKQTAEVNKSAWYALLKLTFRTVAYDASQNSYQLTADVLVENIGTDPADADVPIAFQDGDLQGTSIVDKATSVQAGTKADVTYRFNLPNLTGSLASGVFTIGRGDEARAVVPVGDKVPLVDYKPRAVLAKPVSFTFRDLSLKYDTCEVRGGWPYQFGQAKQGYLMLYCVFDLTYVGTYLGGHYVGVANFRLGLPDGTEVGPANAPNYDASSGQLIPNQPLAYQIKAPAKGTYLLRLVDVHPGEKRAPQYVHETPILL